MLLLSLTMWQCKNDDYVETVGVCPEVLSTVPTKDGKNVVPNRPITVTFNEPMNATTITTSTFLLTSGTNSITGMKQAAAPISGTVTPSTGQTATFTFTPAVPLDPYTVYTGTMKKGVKDPMNNALQEDYVWSFTTQPLATTSANPLIGGTTSGGGLYDVGSTVTATVVPNAGYVFVNWTEAGVVVSTEANYNFNIESNRILVANFSAQYTIALSSLPLAGGTTTGAGAFNSGASVTVKAVPSVGYTFTNWTEGTTVVSPLNDFTFLASVNRTLVANFGINMYLLTVTSLNGTVAKLPNQTTFSHGTSVVLTATPAVGYTFTSWSGDAIGTVSPLTVIMNSEKNITANYTAIAAQFTVGLSSIPLLGGTTSGDGSYNSGASVTAKATANVGFTFTNWTEGANIVSTNANYPFTITASRTLVANFTATVAQFTVGLSSNPLLSGTTTGDGSYNSGASVTAKAIANVGFTFTNWTEGANIVSTNANYPFTITASRTLVANFTPVVAGQFQVDISSNPLFGGSTNGEGLYDSGANVNLKATANSGFTFTNWTEGTNIISTNANYSFTISGNRIFVANFEADALGPVPIDLGSAGNFAVLSGSGVSNTGVTTRIIGDVGAYPTSTINGLLSGNVNGNLYMTADPIVAQAKIDLTTAYNDAQSRSLDAISLPGQLGGLTLAPGLYVNSSTSGISGTGANGILTLDGNANSVWIFKMGSTFITDAGTSIVLAGGAQAKNIFWSVGSSATLGTNSIFYGTILAEASITLTTGAILYGRALTRTAAVTLDSNKVTKP